MRCHYTPIKKTKMKMINSIKYCKGLELWECKVKCIFSNYLVTSLLQFSSVTQSCPTVCDLMNLSTPGLPVYHQLPESTQTHVY